MGIGKRIKEARESLGLTQEELAKMVSVTKAAIGNYETGVSHPKENILYKLFVALNCDANFLFQDEIKYSSSELKHSRQELDHIKKYRALDERGKETVDMTLNSQYEIVQAKKQTSTGFPINKDLPLVAEKQSKYLSARDLYREEMHRKFDEELDIAEKGVALPVSTNTNLREFVKIKKVVHE